MSNLDALREDDDYNFVESPEGSWVCPVCDFGITNSRELTSKQIRDTHLNPPSFLGRPKVEPICKKILQRYTEIERLIEKSKLALYQCPDCPKQIVGHYAFTQHRSTHSKDYSESEHDGVKERLESIDSIVEMLRLAGVKGTQSDLRAVVKQIRAKRDANEEQNAE